MKYTKTEKELFKEIEKEHPGSIEEHRLVVLGSVNGKNIKKLLRLLVRKRTNIDMSQDKKDISAIKRLVK